jgi:hypothetical protein
MVSIKRPEKIKFFLHARMKLQWRRVPRIAGHDAANIMILFKNFGI